MGTEVGKSSPENAVPMATAMAILIDKPDPDRMLRVVSGYL